MRHRLLTSTLSLSLLASLMSIGMLGGCPQAQVPNLNAANTNTNSSSGPAVNTGGDTISRPVPPVVVDTTTSSGNGGSTTGGGGTGGGGTGGGGTGGGTVTLVVDEPSNSVGVRPGANIDVTYQIIDTTGLVASTELIAARDDNADGAADAAPVFVQVLANQTGLRTTTINSSTLTALLTNGFGRFLFGIRTTTTAGVISTVYADGTITIDSIAPTVAWVGPAEDLLLQRSGGSITVEVTTSDNSSHDVTVELVDIDNPLLTFEVASDVSFAAGAATRSFFVDLSAIPAGKYNYRVSVTDGIGTGVTITGTDGATGLPAILIITDRLIGTINLSQLAAIGGSDIGGILQGFNPNDLAGSSMTQVADIDGDGNGEAVIVSRFGKPYNITTNPGAGGVGFGEAYLIYGSKRRGISPLNAVGGGNVPGLSFPGIRTPINVNGTANGSVGWTNGISDATIVPDMDGDGAPEIVFSFPRVESLSLGNGNPLVQHPDLLDGSISGAGDLELDAFDPLSQSWITDIAQFTRGGIVIVSSHNAIMQSRGLTNRKDDRLIDLHEVGQIFTFMGRPGLVPFVRQESFLAAAGTTPDCPDPITGLPVSLTWQIWVLLWDTVFPNQGPGGFSDSWHANPAIPPLANPTAWPFPPAPWNDLSLYPDAVTILSAGPPLLLDPCSDMNTQGVPGTGPDGQLDECQWISFWWSWLGLIPMPCTQTFGAGWDVGGVSAWTGFYGSPTGPDNSPRDYTVGARVLGQAVNDQFGASIGSDGTFLYMAAPKRTPNDADYPTDVPLLQGARSHAGVVYQMRTDRKPNGSPVTVTQLWIEPGAVYPFVDLELAGRSDGTMPVPHQYIVEAVGSARPEFAYDGSTNHNWQPPGNCPDRGYLGEDAEDGPFGGPDAFACFLPQQYSIQTAGYTVDKVAQIVGPHEDSELSFVRGLGDFDGDGINDVAIGSTRIRADAAGAFDGSEVGGLFLISSRSTGLGGDMLLDDFRKGPGDRQLTGVMLRGTAGAKLARVVDSAGDFDGDGLDDVIVGNEAGDLNGVDSGEAILIFGSTELNSPAGGWTVDQLIAEGRGLRFKGVAAGDLAGANVAGAGDVDGDGLGDILIAAPNADGGKGVVYLIYGDDSLSGEIQLSNIGKAALPGAQFIGRVAGDALGGGTKVILNTDPSGGSTQAFSRGVAALGDLNNDGAADFGISAMLADPLGKQDAGEVYIIYGVKAD